MSAGSCVETLEKYTRRDYLRKDIIDEVEELNLTPALKRDEERK